MYIYFDSRDIITLVEKKSSVETNKFEEKLRQCASELIFSMHNIMECCAPLVHNGETSGVMHTLNRLEQMPHVYIAEAKIEASELEEAVSAFTERREYQPIAPPFVPRFDYVVSPFEDPSTKIYVNYRLSDIIYDLYKEDPTLFMGYPDHSKRLQNILKTDRKRNDYKKHEQNFPNTIIRNLQMYNIPFPREMVSALAQWLYASPKRCPAVRLGYEVFHKLLKNITDKGENSDIPDFVHVSCVPYVYAITLDNRMRGYVAQADRSLGTDYSKKVYRNLEEIEALF